MSCSIHHEENELHIYSSSILHNGSGWLYLNFVKSLLCEDMYEIRCVGRREFEKGGQKAELSLLVERSHGEINAVKTE